MSTFFVYLLVIWKSSFVKGLPFAHLKKLDYLIDLWDFIYIYLDISPLLNIYILKISSILWLAFSLTCWYLLMKFVILMKFNLATFLFIINSFGICLQNFCSTQSHENILFSARSFVFYFSHFGVCLCDFCVNLHFLCKL